jgi:diphthamide biosynthesis protein 2
MATPAPALGTAPVLSTPDTHLFEDPTPPVDPATVARTPDDQIAHTYEIQRTVKEIQEGGWKRIALQFPDHMLVDAPRVYEQLGRELAKAQQDIETVSVEEKTGKSDEQARLFILGDTSYGACCVDEVAAEHVSADVVVHYGRSCLSPPSRLPVIYVFTTRPLDVDAALAALTETYPDKETKLVLMADIPYAHHVPVLHTRLQDMGYTNVFATEVVHDPSSALPNRTVPVDAEALREYALFHVADPPDSLLLTLSSRVASTHIYPVSRANPTPTASPASTAMTLRRRYALCTSLSTTPVFGILINTLSVQNYMSILAHVQKMITAAGKKHYTFVVGKVNAAKVANFSEVGGWVVIGCWESSLMDSKDFWRPIITPFELRLALASDKSRVWTGAWDADFGTLLRDGHEPVADTEDVEEEDDTDDDEDDAPPEFDLRTGRYVSHSRPMRSHTTKPIPATAASSDASADAPPQASALAVRSKGDVAAINGVMSPGAEFLRSQRTWQGLGSDYRENGGEVGVGAAKMEEGRKGIASVFVGEGQGNKE